MTGKHQKPGGKTAEQGSAHDPEQKGGAGVVAQGKQPLSVLLITGAPPVQVRDNGGTQGISPQTAQHQSGRAASGKAQQPTGGALQQDAQLPGGAEADEQIGYHKKGEKRGNQGFQAQPDPQIAPCSRRAGQADQSPCDQ